MISGTTGTTRASFLLVIAASVAMFFDSIVRLTDRNFLFSDVLLLLALLILLLDWKSRAAFLVEAFRNPVAIPVIVFLCAGLVGMTAHAAVPGVNPVDSVLASMQLALVFLVIAPMVFVHARNPDRLRTLWTVQAVMIGFAGFLSVTDVIGLTHFNPQPEFWRAVNPLLGVNGFWLFGLISATLLLRVIRSRGAHRWLWGLLWVAGFAGVVLAGVRGGLVLTAASLVWVGRRFLKDLLRPRFPVQAIRRLGVAMLVLFLAATIAAVLLTQVPVFQTRVEMEEVTTVSRRLQAILIALPEIPGYLGLGAGLDQFLNLHPDAGDLLHNHVIQALFETGLLGTIAWLAVTLAGYRNAGRWERHAGSIGDLRAEDHWDASRFAILGALVAGMVYPIGFARFDWWIVLLAIGPRFSGQRPTRTAWRENASAASLPPGDPAVVPG